MYVCWNLEPMNLHLNTSCEPMNHILSWTLNICLESETFYKIRAYRNRILWYCFIPCKPKGVKVQDKKL